MKTTKIIAFFLFLSAFATSSIAQSLSVRAGVNLSNPNVVMGGEKFDELETLTGFQAGFLGEVGSEMLALEIGALYSQKGYTFDESFLIFPGVEGRVAINYLEIPVNGKVYFGPEKARLHVAVGPYLGLALNGKIKVETPEGTEEVDIDFGNEEEDQFKRWDYGLNFGAGVEISRFQLGATYGLGLANLNTFEDDDSSFKHSVIQIHVGYRITE